MARVSEAEVLLLWRALRRFREGKNPACAPRGKPLRSECPLYDSCPRWEGLDDYTAALYESLEETESRRARWPCSRLLDLLHPEVTQIGAGRK